MNDAQQSASRKDRLLLFIGDSITRRSRDLPDYPIGRGFVAIIAERLCSLVPEISIINRGIGGNTSSDLVSRWDNDCIRHAPAAVSILIGINDTIRRYCEGRETPLEQFERNYRDIIERTVKKLKAVLILCEPFLLPLSTDQKKWRDDLIPKQECIRRLAQEYGARFVPFQQVFMENAAMSHFRALTEDGVHPTLQGYTCMADAWMQRNFGNNIPAKEAVKAISGTEMKME